MIAGHLEGDKVASCQFCLESTLDSCLELTSGKSTSLAFVKELFGLHLIDMSFVCKDWAPFFFFFLFLEHVAYESWIVSSVLISESRGGGF